MKKVVLLLVALLLCGCGEHQMTAWMLSGGDIDAVDNEFTGRLGLRGADGVEFGAESNWVGTRGQAQSYGAYALAEMDESIGHPYIGYHASIANDIEDGGLYGPVGGTIITIGGLETVLEYQYRDFTGSMADLDKNDAHKVFAGVRIRF